MQFNFINKNYDLSFLKVGMHVGDNELLKNFDKNNNSIFDADELKDFYNELMPYIEDSKLDETESVSFLAKLFGITLAEAQNKLNDGENDIETALKTLIETQAIEDTIK